MKTRSTFIAIMGILPLVALLGACPTPIIEPPTLSGTVPTAPNGLVVTGQTQDSISLSWNSVTGADTYTVYQSSSLSGAYVSIVTGLTETAYSLSVLIPATTFYFKVSAVNSSGEGAPSLAISGTTVALGSVYAEGYSAFIMDCKKSMSALAAVRSKNPSAGTYLLIGANGGTAVLVEGLMFNDPAPMIVVEIYSWNDYKGTRGSTINGSCTIAHSSNSLYDPFTRGHMTGTLSFGYAATTGSVTYQGSVDEFGVVTGTYTANYNGESHTYDYATGAEI